MTGYKKYLIAATSLVTLWSNYSYSAEDGKWMVRARAIAVIPSEDSTITPIGGKAEIDNNIVPEVDVSYFFTPNIAVELIAATTKHNVKVKNSTAGASVDAGDAWVLPPTLTLQYHFTNFNSFKPYVGAGVNYTHFYNADPGALTNVKYSDSFGPALQVGVDVPIRNNWYFNADIKKVWIDSDVKFSNQTIHAKVDIDPWIFGLGFGYKF